MRADRRSSMIRRWRCVRRPLAQDTPADAVPARAGAGRGHGAPTDGGRSAVLLGLALAALAGARLLAVLASAAGRAADEHRDRRRGARRAGGG